MNRIIIRNYQSLVVQSAKMLDTNDDDIEDEIWKLKELACRIAHPIE
jgi:hypothetical protein